jgi:hypothetical protein
MRMKREGGEEGKKEIVEPCDFHTRKNIQKPS